MELHYWRSPHGNVGDDLNAWLWPRVFGSDFFNSGDPHIFFGIGSILDARVERDARKSIVFGTGLRRNGNYRPDLSRVDIRFVRGPRSVAALENAGLPGMRYISDPAILTPRFLPLPRNPIPGRIGFVPYFQTPPEVAKKIASEAGLELIPVTLDVEEFVKKILRCEYILTEAMHGAILADSYRIPWAACRLYSGITEGRTSLFKWADYAESLGMKPDITNAIPSSLLWAPWQVRNRLLTISTGRAFKIVEKILSREVWMLSETGRLAQAQEAILHEAARLAESYPSHQKPAPVPRAMAAWARI